MRLFKRLQDLLYAMAGMPSYERYLQHQRAAHPEEIPLSYEAFYTRAQKSRYGRRASRCC